MEIDGRELDLDIVTESWRSLTEPEAFDCMIAAWDRKLATAASQPRIPLIDGILKRQLASIDSLLDENRTVKAEDPLDAAVSATPAPAVVLSPQGLVVVHNEGARKCFGARQGKQLGTDWIREDSLADFRAVRKSGLAKGNANYAIIRIVIDGGGEALAEAYRLDVKGKDGSFTVVRSLELDWNDNVTSGLSQAFGLTSAEADICRLLFAHRNLEIVASKRGVALETVRNQVKRILGKVELHSKTELIRMLALLCARANSEMAEADLAWSDPFGNETLLTRRDGRKLAYAWVGAEDGRPLLFIHGTISYFYIPEVAREALTKAGIKLICPSMPNFGNSDPAGARDQLLDGCEAIEELCEALELGPVPAIAAYSGQAYLTRLAHLRPDMFSMLCCVGISWSLAEDRSAALPVTQRIFARLARDAPMAFDVLCRVAYQVVKKRGVDFYLERSFGDTDVDRHSITDPDLLALLKVGFRHLNAQGHTAFHREKEMSAKTPMSGWLEDVKVPIHWMVPQQVGDVGETDLARIRAFNPLISAELVEGAGQMMPYQKPQLFTERLIALASDDPRDALAAHDPARLGTILDSRQES